MLPLFAFKAASRLRHRNLCPLFSSWVHGRLLACQDAGNVPVSHRFERILRPSSGLRAYLIYRSQRTAAEQNRGNPVWTGFWGICWSP